MEPTSPESGISKSNTVLKGRLIESIKFEREIQVAAENIGASKWQEMLESSQSDGLERGLLVFKNLFGNKFESGNIFQGNKRHVSTSLDEQGPKSKFASVAVTVHTHPTNAENEHLITMPPGDGDIQILFNTNFGAGSMVILDKSGAHLLIRTSELRGDPPPSDLIKKLADEIQAENGTTLDVQRKMNGRLSEFGVSYYFTDNLLPTNGMITFKRP